MNGVAPAIAPGHPLADRYAAAVSGEERRLGRSEFPMWKRRLLLDGGFVGRPPVRLASLPEEVGAATTMLWSAIEILVQVRMLSGTRPTDPHPLARRFLVRWTALSEWQVRTAMEELERLTFVARVSSFTRPGGRWATVLWTVRLAVRETGDRA